MITTMRELRDLIANNCDRSKPLRIVSYDVGKKAKKHSTLYVDVDHPAKFSASLGKYDERALMEMEYREDGQPLMPDDVLEALDDLLDEEPKATIGWVYFFYFPLDYRTLFGRVQHIECSLLDSSKVKDVYLVDEDPNSLVIKAEYEVGSFDM